MPRLRKQTLSFYLSAAGATAEFALVLLGAFIYLYFILFVPHCIPISAGLGDDKLFLSEATRILQGQVIYRDFSEFYLPGTAVLYAQLIRLFGPRAWIPNACLIFLGIGFLWTSIVLSRKLIGRAGMFLPGFLFLWVSFHTYLDAAPHWYSNLLIITAVAALAEERSEVRLILAGGLTGLAACFAQHHGAFAALGFSVFIWWEGSKDEIGWRRILRRELYFLIPFLSIPAGFAGYYAARAGPDTFISSTIVFPLTSWRNGEVNDWSEYIGIQLVLHALHFQLRVLRLMILALLVPGIYIVAIASYRRHGAGQRPTDSWRRILLLSVIGLSAFASVMNSASYWRIATISLPALLVAVWMLERTLGCTAIYFLWAVSVVLMLNDIRFAQKNHHYILDSPSGQIALSSSDPTSLYEWLRTNTIPREYVFEADGWDVYFWFGLENPTKLRRLLSSGYPEKKEVNDVLEDLRKHQPRLILWDSDLDWGIPPASDPLQPLRKYLYAHYRKIRVFAENSGAEDSVWERTSSQ